MLKALHLGNFKAFAATQRIPIRPITLIFGPNSSGKSSIVHSLALAHEALRTRNLDIKRTKIGGRAIDLGGFAQYVFCRDTSRRVTWGVELEAEESLDEAPRRYAVQTTFGLVLDDKGRPIPDATPVGTSFDVDVNESRLLRMSSRPHGMLEVDELEQTHQEWTRAFLKIPPYARPGTKKDVVFAKNPNFIATNTGLFPHETQSPTRSHPGTDKLLNHSITYAGRNLLRWIFDVVEKELKRLVYLGPLRSYPPRHLAFSETDDDPNWVAGGGKAWERLRKSAKLRKAVNNWLGSKERLETPYELMLRPLIAPQAAEGSILLGVEEIRKQLKRQQKKTQQNPLEVWDSEAFAQTIMRRLERDRGAASARELILFDKRTDTEVSHRDVGVGISQVLPVLVNAYGSKSRLVAIEQPEIHLHPKLQAELADVFIDSALGGTGNTLLLETHSEHLILRVMRRIRETTRGTLPEGMAKVRPEDVAVLYVVPEKSGATIREIPLTDQGKFGGLWPGGFFPERTKELF